MGRFRKLLPKKGDQPEKKFLRWPLIWVLAIPAIIIAGDASPMGPDIMWRLLCQPVLLFFWLVVALFATVVIVRSTRKELWPNAVSAAVLPIVVLAAAYNPFGFIRLCNHIGNAANLLVTQSKYIEEVNKLSADGQPKLIVFNRGGMIWSSEGFIYDEADQVALPPKQQSVNWKLRAEETAELSCGPYEAIPLWGHFYYGGFSC
jgi:hypothetical protein